MRYSGNGFPPGPTPRALRAEVQTASYLANVNERLENLQVNRPQTRPASAANLQPVRFETRRHMGHFFSQGATREPSPTTGMGIDARGQIFSQAAPRVLSQRANFGIGGRWVDINNSTPASPRPDWL